MKRNLRAGVSAAVVSGLLLAAAPMTARAATVEVAAPAAESKTAPAKSDPANRWWGLPTAIVGDTTGMPMTTTASATAGLVKDAGSEQYLPGLHAKGQRVLRGGAPVIGRIDLAEKDGRYVVTVPVGARTALAGKPVKGAHEDVAVRLSVTGADGETIVDRTSWRPLDTGMRIVGQPYGQPARTFTLSRARTEQIKAMTPEERDANIRVEAFQVIDTDGRKTQGRWTAEHFKTSTTSLGDSQAAPQSSVNGQGVGLTVQNNDALTNSSGTVQQTVNLTQQPTSCMQTGTSGTSALNVTGLAYGATTEGYLQQDTGDKIDDMLVDGGEEALERMYTTVATEVISQTFAEVTDTLLTFFEAVKVLENIDSANCGNTPGMFTLTVADAWGNSTQQAYGLNEFFADGYGYDTDGGTQDTGGAGGMADISTVFASAQPYGYGSNMKDDQNTFYANYNTYLGQVYGNNGVGPAPLNQVIEYSAPGSLVNPPNMVAGGDAGLSLTVAPNASNGETASGWSSGNVYPEIQLNISSNGNCSSVFGGTWGDDYATNADGEIEGTDNPAQFWEATTPTAGCSNNAPNTINPASWGTVAITAPVGTGGAQTPITTAYANQPVTASATVTLAPATAGFSWAWYDCGTDATCATPTLLSDTEGSTAWNAGYATTQDTYTIPETMNGNYLALGAYPASLGGFNPGTITMSAPVQVQTLAPYVGPNPLVADGLLPAGGPATLELTGPTGATGPTQGTGPAPAGATLTAAEPNNWAEVSTSGGEAKYQTTWYGCNDVSTTGGAGVCTGEGVAIATIPASSPSYTIPDETDYTAIYFTQTVTVTYPNGASYSATGTSNTLFVGGGVPVFTTLPGISMTPADVNACTDCVNGVALFAAPAGPIEVSSPQASGDVEVTYQMLTCDTPIPATSTGSLTEPACAAQWQWLGNASSPSGLVNTTVTDGVITGTAQIQGGGSFQSEFAYVSPIADSAPMPETSDVAVVVMATATNYSGSTVAYSPVWSAVGSPGPTAVVVPPSIGSAFPYTQPGSCTSGVVAGAGTATLGGNAGTYNQPINPALTTFTWTSTVPGSATPVVATGESITLPYGTPVTLTAQTYDVNGNAIPGGPWTTGTFCWPPS